VTGVLVERNELVTDAEGRVAARPTGDTALLEAGVVLTSVGYRGVPTVDLPFDDARAVIPNDAGRVLTAPGGEIFPGTYVTGWIKRGPTGFIGTNKSCAQETVQQLADDFNGGTLREPTRDAQEFDRLVRARRPQAVAGGAAVPRDRSVRRLFARS